MIDRRTLGGQVISAVLVALFVRSSEYVGNQVMSVHPHSPEAVLPAILRSLFGAQQRLEALGCACLSALPEAERRRDRLSNILFHGALRGTKTITARHNVRRLLAEQVRNDFATGAVLSVDHWLLSLTETRVYALSALG
jgi:hypothetical protein